MKKVPFRVKSLADVEHLMRSMPACEQIAYQDDTTGPYSWYVRAKAGGPPLAKFRSIEHVICFAGGLSAIALMRKALHLSKKAVIKLRQLDIFGNWRIR